MMIEIGSGKMGIYAPIIRKGQVHVLFRPSPPGPIGFNLGPAWSDEDVNRSHPNDFWLRITSVESAEVLLNVLQHVVAGMKKAVQELPERTVA